jgi:hypothetical protein
MYPADVEDIFDFIPIATFLSCHNAIIGVNHRDGEPNFSEVQVDPIESAALCGLINYDSHSTRQCKLNN